MQLGGVEEAFQEIEVELDGMKLLDCLNKVYESSGRQGKAIKRSNESNSQQGSN